MFTNAEWTDPLDEYKPAGPGYTAVASGPWTMPCIGTEDREVLCLDAGGSGDWQPPY